MQITLLLILFATPVFAANLCDQDKDPLINKCYLEACTTPTNKVVLPATDKDFAREVSSSKITKSSDEQASFEKEANKVAAALKRSSDFVKEKGAEKIAEDILAQPMTNLQGIHDLLKERFVLTQSENGQFSVIHSDIEDDEEKIISKRLSAYLLDLKNNQRAYEEFKSDKSDLDKQNNYLIKITHDLADAMESKNKPKAQELRKISQKIASDKSRYFGPKEMLTYFQEADLNILFESKSAAIKKDIAHAINKRMETRQKRPAYKDVLFKSCQVASYMIGKVKGRNLGKEYDKAKQDAIRGLNDKFLKNSCPEIANFLKQTIQGDVFKAIELNKNFLPEFGKLENEISKFSQMKDSKTFLDYVSFTDENSKDLLCDISTFTPTDKFMGQVNTSMFTLAMGYHNVVSHELGHWVSRMLKIGGLGEACSGKFKKLRACISKFYEEQGPDMYQLYSGDNLRTEEDFADWFSAMTSNDKSNFDCDIDKITDLISGFMGYKAEEKSNIYLPNSADPHSSNLFRVLHAKLIRKEPLSKSCDDLVKKHPEASPKKCDY